LSTHIEYAAQASQAIQLAYTKLITDYCSQYLPQVLQSPACHANTLIVQAVGSGEKQQVHLSFPSVMVGGRAALSQPTSRIRRQL